MKRCMYYAVIVDKTRDKWQTHPLIREGTPQWIQLYQLNPRHKIWSWVPRGPNVKRKWLTWTKQKHKEQILNLWVTTMDYADVVWVHWHKCSLLHHKTLSSQILSTKHNTSCRRFRRAGMKSVLGWVLNTFLILLLCSLKPPEQRNIIK